jgi:hypothetical protein
VRARWLLAATLAAVLAAGCDYPFQPFQESSEAFFSMFGQLDLNADTQWVRVMPVRQDLFLKPEPIDAVVTLENLKSGKVVALADSLFAFPDEGLGGVGYAYNFWTTDRLEPGASYRVRATRSDGAATTALVTMPTRMEISLIRVGRVPIAFLLVKAEHLVFVDAIHTVRSRGGAPVAGFPLIVPQRKKPTLVDSTTQSIGVDALALVDPTYAELGRSELRISVARAGWPFRPEAKDLGSSLLDTIPSNVSGGLGFVGGIETRTIPFHTCETLTARADAERTCAASYAPASTSISGRVIARPCGAPYAYREIRLQEKFADGGSDVRGWTTGFLGEYRFEGLEPSADLMVDLGAGTPAVRLPRLAPGQRYVVDDLFASGGC